MMNQPADILMAARPDRHFKRIEGKIRTQVIPTCQPTIRRANKSITNAVYTHPENVITYVISATQRRFGAGASKQRASRSDGRPDGSPGTVVRGRFRLDHTPPIPRSRISRSTVHRATGIPCRLNSSHTFRAP